MTLSMQNPAGGPGFTGRSLQAERPNYSPIDLVLSRLEGVRSSGKGYRSRCPACGGKSNKVSITEAPNGGVLLHAFCGCSAGEVLSAVGLQMGDLFARPLGPLSDSDRRVLRQHAREAGWAAALETLVIEGTIALIAARQLSGWVPLSAEDDDRLLLAVTRLESARQVLRGR